MSQICPVKDYHSLSSLCILCILYRKYTKFYFEDYLCGQNILHFILHEKCERGTKKQFFPKLNFIEQFAGVAWPGVVVTMPRTESQTAANPGPQRHIVPHYECLFRTISKSISNIDTTNFNTKNILSVGKNK